MSKPYDIRLRRYTPGGAAGAILPTLTIDYTAPYSAIPALSFTYSEAVTGVLPALLELGVEVWDGSTWTEPRNGRFFALKRSGNDIDQTLTRTVTAVAFVSYVLSKATVVKTDGTTDLVAKGAVGKVVNGVYNDAKARGWGSYLGVSFTDTADSAGAPWNTDATLDTLNIKVGTTLTSLVQTLADQGCVEYSLTGRTLDLYNPGTGSDYSAGTNRATVGGRAKGLPVDTTNEDLATDVTVHGDGGKSWTFPVAGATTALGRLEVSIDAGGVTTQAQAAQFASLYGAIGADTRSQYTMTEDAATAAARALVEYLPGDWVSARRATGWQRMRVTQVQVRKAVDGKIDVDVILDDVLHDLAARIAKRNQALGGRIGGNGRLSMASIAGYIPMPSTVTPGSGDTESQYWGDLLTGDKDGKNIYVGAHRGGAYDLNAAFPRLDFNGGDGAMSFNGGNGAITWKVSPDDTGSRASIDHHDGVLRFNAEDYTEFNTDIQARFGVVAGSVTINPTGGLWFTPRVNGTDTRTRAMSWDGNGDPFTIEPDSVKFSGRFIQAKGVYDQTTTAASNVFVDSNGNLQRSTSAARYKLDQQAGEVSGKILEVTPKTWFDIGQVERNDGSTDGLRRVPGLIAEEVKAAGLDGFVIYGEDGQTEGVMYDRLWTELIPVVRAQRDRIDALEERLAKLEAKAA